MTKPEVLKAMLSDPELMEKYGITQEKIDQTSMMPFDNSNMIAVIQSMVNIVGSSTYTNTTAAANLSSFLESRLNK